MKNRWILVLAFVAVFALGGALGVAAERYYVGGIPSNVVSEEFKMSVGVSASGTPNRPNWIKQDREVVNIPSHFGRLVSVDSTNDSAVFWFEGDGGRLRNVVIDQPANTWYMLRPTKSTELKVSQRK